MRHTSIETICLDSILSDSIEPECMDSALFVVCIASQERIRAIKDNLQSCKNLLHCKRDELRKLWQEGQEHKMIVEMLDQMYAATRVAIGFIAHINRQLCLATDD